MDIKKVCKKCGLELNLDEFYKNKSAKDGHVNQCKKCVIGYQKLISNPDKKKIYDKNYNFKNKEKVSVRSKEYYKEHKEQHSRYTKEYYKEHMEEIKAYKKEWASTDMQKAKKKESTRRYCLKFQYKKNILTQKYRAKKKLLPNNFTNEQWQQAKDHFNNRCAYCNRELPLAQDHFKSLSTGGEYTLNNIIPSCKSCNSSKSNKSFEVWYKTYKFYNYEREKNILEFLNYKNGIQQLKII